VRAPEPSPARVSQRAADEAEAYAALADLVTSSGGSGRFDFADTDEFIEGLAPGLDRRILRKLKRGDFALQGHVDLHGMTREEAHAAVDEFVAASRAAGRRCVLIVHGRGQHSKDQIPVLKERVRAWLERGKIAKAVLAFSTARPCDGGLGAVYVLLRK
jgi:DNA-nicking Smr family endonuclease